MLNIHAKMDRKSDDGSRFYQEISREYLLPETLKIEELKSIFTDDGVMDATYFINSSRSNNIFVFPKKGIVYRSAATRSGKTEGNSDRPLRSSQKRIHQISQFFQLFVKMSPLTLI
jgi:hypothetical protein